MSNLLLVGLGGFLGSIARYKIGALVLHFSGPLPGAGLFPYSTWVINILGCLVMGLLAGMGERCDFLSPGARLFLLTGILGGFTTFSAFGLETVFLLRRGQWPMAALYAGSSVVLGVLALGLGLMLVLRWGR